jgi:hypothetical protein
MNSKWFRSAAYCSALLIIAGCATPRPIGPRVTVMPAPGKPFEVFVAEESQCRQYAEQSLGMTPDQVSSNSFAASAAAGTAIGTAAGALLGGREGAATGAGMGLLVGSAAGSGQAEYSARDAQWRYDNAYMQCMYAKGNQVPGYPVQRQIPPPPPGKGAPYPPPPPPR